MTTYQWQCNAIQWEAGWIAGDIYVVVVVVVLVMAMVLLLGFRRLHVFSSLPGFVAIYENIMFAYTKNHLI